jgi:hypothetical protein
MPLAKYSFALSSLKLAKGRTAMLLRGMAPAGVAEGLFSDDMLFVRRN